MRGKIGESLQVWGNSPKTDLIFTNREVWLPRSSDLNDPCECSMHELAQDWMLDKVREMKQAQMEGSLLFGGRKNRPFFKEIKATLPSIPDFDQKYEAFREIYKKHFVIQLSRPDQLFSKLDRQLNSIGVFSLSANPDHPLMWSHYAEEHRGICLGFELRDLTLSTDPQHFLEVKYSDEIPRIDEEGFIQEIVFPVREDGKPQAESSISLKDTAVRAAISTKSTCWEYESEWRYVEPEGNRTYPFPGPLVEIIFGLRCTPEMRAHYTNLARTHLVGDVRLYEIRRIKNSFLFERVFLGICASTRKVVPVTPQQDGPADQTNPTEPYSEILALLANDQFSRALPLVEEALRRDPNSSMLWSLKGIALGYQMRHEEAMVCFARSIQLDGSYFSPWYHKGVALTQLKRYEEAVIAYEEALKLMPSDASTVYNLAIVLYELNDLARVRELLCKAEKHGHPRARNMLDRVEKALQNPKQPQ